MNDPAVNDHSFQFHSERLQKLLDALCEEQDRVICLIIQNSRELSVASARERKRDEGLGTLEG